MLAGETRNPDIINNAAPFCVCGKDMTELKLERGEGSPPPPALFQVIPFNTITQFSTVTKKRACENRVKEETVKAEKLILLMQSLHFIFTA